MYTVGHFLSYNDLICSDNFIHCSAPALFLYTRVYCLIWALCAVSINDKVVIFDRVREFFGLYPKRDKRQLFNDSLNTTLARTINTSLSTLIVLLCIFILGGDSIRSFAFAMILGVVIGTLSSLFIASPIAYNMMKNKKVVPVTTEE